jgi:hypothetical protein
VGIEAESAVVRPTQPGVGTHDEQGARLSAAERVRLATMPAGRRVRVLLASKVGRGGEAAALVRSVGGSVWRADYRAGFVIADVTPDQAGRLDGAPVLTGFALDGKVAAALETSQPSAGRVSARSAATAPSATTPYFPADVIGASQFTSRHPAFDGRGVVVGVIDSGVTVDTPGLQTTSTGQPKVTEHINLMHNANRVVTTNRVVPVDGGTITVDGQTYTLPAGVTDHEVRVGELREDHLYFNAPWDLNRDGDSTDVFPAVVAGTTRQDLTIWFDTDRDGSFADEDGLRDWGIDRTITRVGRDNPDTTNVGEYTPVAVNLCQTAGATPCVTRADRLGDVWDLVGDLAGHGTEVSSVAAGNDMEAFGKTFDGVAPGAQILDIQAFGSPDFEEFASDTAAGFLFAAEQGADVINCSCTIFRYWAPNAFDVLNQLVDNLIVSYGVPVALAAGNTAFLASQDQSPTMTRNTIAVGAMLTPSIYERNLLREGITDELVTYYSAPGPLTNGGYSPDVLVPSAMLGAIAPRVRTHTEYFARTPVENFPPGYRILGGTSVSSPMVAGALANLISAARAEGVHYTPHTLKRALELGARPLDTSVPYQVVETGHGLVQLGEAWKWLKRLGAEGAIDRDVNTRTYNEFFGQGDGIYQRNYFDPTVPVTLYTSTDQTHTYNLRASEPWIELSRKRIGLPGNSSVEFSVNLDPSLKDRPGLHSGVVTVDDPTTADPADHEMMVVVVTPTPLDENNQLHVSGSGKTGLEAEHVRRLFFTVPPGATSVRLQLTTPADTQAGVMAGVASSDRPSDAETQRFIENIPDPGNTVTAESPDPPPGVWELFLQARDEDRTGPIVTRHGYDITVTVS